MIILRCKCGALPNIYQEGLAKRNIETNKMFFVDTYEYSVECDECGEAVWARERDDAIQIWNEKMSTEH